jgi:uncharacterized protein YndB with AHSA1/START domain
VVEGVDERQRPRRMTSVDVSVEIDAPPDRVWKVTSDPANLPHWDRHIEAVHVPPGGLGPGVRYDVVMRFMGLRTTVRAEVGEWEPPSRAVILLTGPLEARVATSIAPLPHDRSALRHMVEFRFNGPLGAVAAASLRAVGGARFALRRGTLAQKRGIESG